MALKLKSIRDKKPEAIVLVGLPASGKSTWAWDFKGGYPVLSVEAHIERLSFEAGISFAEGIETFSRAGVAAFKQDIDKFIAERKPFIWDQANLTRSERDAIYRLLSPTHSVTYVCFFVPVEECVRRAGQRANDGGLPVEESRIRKLAAIADFPTPRSGERYDRIVRLEHPAWKKTVVRG